MHDVIIVGGGAIGLAVGRNLAATGRSVLVLDRGNVRDAASWAAAGMLAPQSEADSRNPFFDLCMASANLYRPWIHQLHQETGIDPEYADSGLLFLASTEESLCRLRRTAEWQRAAGFKTEVLSPEDTRHLEPRLTLPLTGAVLMPSESHVTPRRLLEALTASCSVNHVEIRSGVRVLGVRTASGKVTGVQTATETFSAHDVVIASGVRSGELDGLSPPIPVTPRKGQILSLLSNPPGFSRMIRWEHAYMVPRRSGEIIVGATNEDVGFDRSITPSGIGSLLASVQQLSSHVSSLPIGEMWTGLRPSTPDGLPVIGSAAVEGLMYATGHYRNGILLAPATAVAVLSLMENKSFSVSLDAFSPSRFAV